MTDFYEWDGQTYRGAKAVAEDAGVNIRRVYRHLEVHGNLHGLTGDVLLWRGREFRSAAAVAEAAGVSRYTVHWHLREHGSLERLGSGRWGSKSGAAATCGRRDEDVASTVENRGCA